MHQSHWAATLPGQARARLVTERLLEVPRFDNYVPRLRITCSPPSRCGLTDSLPHMTPDHYSGAVSHLCAEQAECWVARCPHAQRRGCSASAQSSYCKQVSYSVYLVPGFQHFCAFCWWSHCLKWLSTCSEVLSSVLSTRELGGVPTGTCVW